MSNTIYTMNHNVPNQLSKIAQWHKERNLINGATNETQFVKLIEEVIELYATLNSDMEAYEIAAMIRGMVTDIENKGRIKQAPAGKDIKDDVGDINVVLMNIIEREGFTMQQCLETAWNDIKDRKGKMIDGMFVKEADL
tara:strand:+ start:573 stop:989 length:417 start_codon:yes stop_codon:yes gene_type:complete